MAEKSVLIYDATLREGMQMAGVSFDVEDKIRILKSVLEDLSFDVIECGWPGSNPKDLEFFEKVKELNLTNGKIAVFGSTRKKDKKVEEDENLNALIKSGAKIATIFGKSWDLHVLKALETTLEDNLNMIKESVEYLKKAGMDVFYDAEHFFDGYKDNKEYALSTLQAAIEGGASWIILCDTNGGSLPYEVFEATADVNEMFNIPLGIHAHNDSGMGNANALAAFRAGARQIQGTINGFGERCGNTNLSTIIPILKIKLGIDCISDNKLRNLTKISHFVYEMANMTPNEYAPFVGKNAFTHKGGIHVSAMLKDVHTYEHINPELVGNTRDIKISELSGRSSILHTSKKFGLPLDENNPKIAKISEVIKEKENAGCTFEGAEGSLEILMKSVDMSIDNPDFYKNIYFQCEGFRVITEMFGENYISEATIKVNVKGKEYHTAAEGNGPVNALDNALKKSLIYFYPSLKEIDLSDFKVRIIKQSGTASAVRVLAETYDDDETWGTVGAHNNIIVASFDALVDSYVYKLLKDKIKW